MSLFEKLNNKRYDLHEKVITKNFSPNSDGKVLPNSNNKNKSAKEITKKYNKLNPNRPEFDKSLTPSQRNLKNIQQNKGKIGKLVVNPSKQQKARGLTPGDIDFTNSDELMKKREARINKRTGKITQKGIRDFASSFKGANRPDTKLSKAQIKDVKSTARKISIAKPGDKYYNWKKQIEAKANTRDYAGKSTRKRPSSAPSYAEVKKKIDAKNPTYIGKSGKPLPVAGKQSIVTPAGKLKSGAFGDVVRPGQSRTFKPYYPKTTRGKIWKFIKTNTQKGWKQGSKIIKKHPKAAALTGLALSAYGGYKYYQSKKPKKYEPITPVSLTLNLNRSKRDMVPNPKYNAKDPNSKKKISRQKFDIENRNIYTGKLLKPPSAIKKK